MVLQLCNIVESLTNLVSYSAAEEFNETQQFKIAHDVLFREVRLYNYYAIHDHIALFFSGDQTGSYNSK